ncbi:TldD/PmbA family protein [Bacteroidota bacterium]
MNYSVRDIPRRDFLRKGLTGGIVLAAAPAMLTQLLSCQGGGSSSLKPNIDPQLLNRIIKMALEKGGDFAEVYVENRISRRILMEESKFKSAVYGVSQGAGIRVISGDKTGYAYTDEITEDKLKRAAEVASFIARGSKTSTPVGITASERKSFVTVKQPLLDIADAKRIEIMQRANQAAMDYDKRIKMATISYYDEVRGRTIANSEGILLSDELPLLFFIVETLGEGNNTMHKSRDRLSRHSGFEMFEEVSPEEVAKNAAREAIVMLDAKDCPAGKMDIVMQNGWGGVLVHEAVGHPLEADSIAKKIGAFTGKLGQKVASDVFTMVDDGTIPNLRGTINFDDEGTQMKKNILIKNGVLEKYMTDILSAKQINQERTGNGRRESYRNMPIPRMTNTYIDNGDSKPEDILSSTKNGLYVQSLSGGSVNSVNGMFNFTCREAYMVEDGKKSYPVKGATLVGNCLEVVANVDAVGDDLGFGSGICGKGQSAEVTAGQPTIRIRGMNVGGSKS